MKRPFALLAGLAIAGMLGVGLWFGVSRVAAQAPTPTPGSQAPAQSARGWLGVILREINGQVIISQVLPGSPAAQAGAQANDRLVSINGQNVTTIQQVQNILNPLGPGTTVQLVVNRNNQNQTISVTLGTVPAKGMGPRGRHGFGAPFLPGLNIPFDRWRGGSFSYVDDQGRTQTLVLTLGTVTSVDAANNRFTIEKNGGGSQTYRTDGNTRVPGSLSQLQNGQPVAVITNQATPDLALSVRPVGRAPAATPPPGRGGVR
jgi:membrane-associated protease RseP (regulator of RpoE activity)